MSLRFGPLFRFVAGAEYTARALSRKLARKRQAEMLELPAHSERLRAGQAAADEKVEVVIADRPPRVLLIATIPWMFSARLACVLRKSGFHVEAICRVGHPLRQLSMPISIHQMDWIWEAASIEKAIEHANPDILISCDGYLHELHRRASWHPSWRNRWVILAPSRRWKGEALWCRWQNRLGCEYPTPSGQTRGNTSTGSAHQIPSLLS